MNELEEKVCEAESIRGSGTELVSLYVQPDENIHSVQQMITSEEQQASNIKSKETRTNVTSALS